MDLGQKLREARLSSGLKQEELAKHLGVSRQTISNWENGRSLPDVGSAVKLSGIYGISLDELLRDESSVLKVFEDLVTRRRKFWQMMLEVGIILELIATLLMGQQLLIAAAVFLVAGIVLEYISVFMHLRVFDHDWGELLRGIIGLILHMGCNGLAMRAFAPPLALSILRIVAFLLILSAGVFTIDFKSTRLWLIVALFIGVPILNFLTALQDVGGFNQADPTGQSYAISQVLYPEDGAVDEYTKVELAGTYLYASDRNGDRVASYGPLSYAEPIPGDTRKGFWSVIPEDSPEDLLQVTVEADDSVVLSYYRSDELLWRGLLTPYGRNTCVVDVSTFGKSIYFQPNWYAPGRADPVPNFGHGDIVGDAKVKLTVTDLPEEALTLYEEYHHGTETETATYTLSPVKLHHYELEVSTRYDGKEEWALYRIPFEDGEYRFILIYE